MTRAILGGAQGLNLASNSDAAKEKLMFENKRM